MEMVRGLHRQFIYKQKKRTVQELDSPLRERERKGWLGFLGRKVSLNQGFRLGMKLANKFKLTTGNYDFTHRKTPL